MKKSFIERDRHSCFMARGQGLETSMMLKDVLVLKSEVFLISN